MNILVFTKRVPAAQEEEIKIAGDGRTVDLSKIPFKINDWDTYAIEEAVKIVEKSGGAVTGIALGDKESDEVLRRAIAMGAKDGFLVEMDAVVHDPFERARIARTLIEREKIPFDMIFTGVQSEDDQFGAFGAILAALLKIPFASMVIGIDELEKDHLVVRRELEGGLQERIRMTLPCVLGIQSGINEPRYVSIMGIRKASKVERRVFHGADYADGSPHMVEVNRWVYPAKKEGATMLEGDVGEACTKLLALLKEKGVRQ